MAVVGKGFAVFEKRQVPHERFSCLAGLGRNASPGPGAVQAPCECVSAMNYGPNLTGQRGSRLMANPYGAESARRVVGEAPLELRLSSQRRIQCV